MSTPIHFWEEPLYRLILQVTLVQVFILGGIAVGIVWFRLVKLARQKRNRQISAALYTPLMGYIAGDVSIEATVDEVRGFPKYLVSMELEKYALMLGGEALSKIRALYERLDLSNLGLKLSHSTFWWRRLEGVRLLGVTGGGEVVDVLVDALRDNHAIVRLAAARSLGRVRSPKAIKPMLEIMAEAKQLSRRQLAQTLVAFGSAAHPALRRIVAEQTRETKDERFLAMVMEVLAITGDVESEKEIRAAITSPYLEVRIAAVKAAALLHLPLKSEELTRALKDEAWQVRAQAAIAAGKLGSEEVVGVLGECLRDHSWWVRSNAGAALAQLGERGIRALEDISETSDDRFARDMAFRTLTSDPLYHVMGRIKEIDPHKGVTPFSSEKDNP
jgi:hypothetical protein